MKWIIRIGILTVGIPSLAIGLLVLARFRPGRGHVSSEIDIKRPAVDVFNWISKPELMGQWVGGVSQVARSSPPQDGENVGERFRTVESDAEQSSPATLDIVVTELVPGLRFGLQIESTGNPETSFTEVAEYNLSESRGMTRVDFEAQTTYHGKVSRYFEPFITAASRKKFQHDLERLKALVEAEPAGNRQ